MRKWVRWVTSVFLVVTLAHAQVEPLIPAETLQAQLDFIVQTIEEVHPDPYARISKEVFEEEVERVKASLDEPLTSAQFYELVAPLVGSLNDSHTSLLSATLTPKTFEARSLDICRRDATREFYTVRDVGVLSMSSFDSGVGNSSATREEVQAKLEDYAQFVKEAFARFKEAEVEAVVIDMRDNPGGNSLVGDTILQYLTDKPYRMVASVNVKVSEQSKARELRLNNYRIEDPVGTILRFDGEFKMPAPSPLNFNGDVYVLTSRCTASSAMRFASVIKDFEFGTVVGEETGGLPTNFGDFITFNLPETNLELRVSHKYFVRPGGFDDRRGVLPDVEVPASQALGWVLSNR